MTAAFAHKQYMCNVRHVKETKGRAAAIDAIATATLRPVLGPMAKYAEFKTTPFLMTRRRGWNRLPAWFMPHDYWHELCKAARRTPNTKLYETVREARKDLTSIVEATIGGRHTVVCHDTVPVVTFTPTAWYQQVLTDKTIGRLPERFQGIAKEQQVLVNTKPMPLREITSKEQVRALLSTIDVTVVGES